MKKIFITLGILLSVFATTSCSQSLLDIPQKGVVSMDDFYKTDADALAAITAVYAQMRSIHYNYMFLTNLPSDNVYCGGGARGDNDQWAAINEFRINAQNSFLPGMYRGFYNLIYKCNLVICNFAEGSSSDIDRCIAEARALRAWGHMQLTIFWGNPPKIDFLMDGSERPTNTPPSELWPWIISEFEAASSKLPSKASVNDKEGGIRLTREAALAFEGKAQVFNGDYSGAKTTLKKVIDSGKYALVPAAEMKYMWRSQGNNNSEKIFEVNVVKNGTNTYDSDMRMLMWGWRSDHIAIMPKEMYGNSWGFFNPTKQFYNEFLAHDGNSTRITSWVKTYAQVEAMNFGTDQNGNPNTFRITKPLFGNEGYFDYKHAYFYEDAVLARGGYAYLTNRQYMRYAEVLLLYAEACAKTNDDGTGLAALNAIQSRAGAPLTALTLDNVKEEKRFELYLEGCRFADLVRWGDAATKLGDHYPRIPECGQGNVVEWPYTNEEYGFKAGKNEVMPYPNSEISINPELVQNPGYGN